MRHSEILRKIFAGLMIVITSLPLSALAQEGEKAGDKKDEKKVEELPLKPAGTIKFTTNEGTWMSLDVSPGRQTIIFDMLGDIYTLPIRGGEAKKIIGGMSFESQPKFSPDGKIDRFPERPQRRRECLGRERRRHRPESDHERAKERCTFRRHGRRTAITSSSRNPTSRSARSTRSCITRTAVRA